MRLFSSAMYSVGEVFAIVFDNLLEMVLEESASTGAAVPAFVPRSTATTMAVSSN